MKHFSFEERQMVELLVSQKQSYRSIGRALHRSHTSIREEILRNRGPNGIYKAVDAHKITLVRHHKKRKRSKIEISPGLKQYIVEQITQYQWSPEQIAGALRIKSGGRCVISHETIYQFVYSAEGKRLGLYRHLRRRTSPRRQPKQSRKRRISIPDRVSIHHRQKRINQRQEFGHWEIDLMIFSNQKYVLAVSVERMTRRTLVTILPNKTAQEMKQALYRLLLDFGQGIVLSMTFDNGTENVLHHELKYEFPGLETYFCDPYCSWQKGTVENTNGLLRQYFPRHCDLGSYSQQDIDAIVHKLNNRPRKCLNFSTPSIAFNTLSRLSLSTP